MQAVESDARVSFEELRSIMRGDLAKMRHLFSLSFYLLCTALLVMLLAVHRVSFHAADAPLYYQLQAEKIYTSDQFRDMKSPDEFYGWLRGAMYSVANSTRYDHMRVLNYAAMRQIRLYLQGCGELGRHSDAVDSITQSYMYNHRCVVDPQEDSSGLANTFGGVNGTTYAKANTQELKGFFHIFDFHDFSNSDIEFLTVLELDRFKALLPVVEEFERNQTRAAAGPLPSPSPNGTASPPLVTAAPVAPPGYRLTDDGSRIRDDVDDLEANGWIDELTSGVVIDTITMFPQRNMLVVVSFVMERTTTGFFSVQVQTDAFRFFVSHRGIITLDVLIFICFLFIVALLCVDLHEEFSAQLMPPNPTWKDQLLRGARSVGIMEVFTFALVMSILTVTGMRLRLWDVSGRQLEDVSGPEGFNLCVDSYFNYKRIYELYCVSLVLVAFRLFYAFRYIAGLSKITNTLSRSRVDLLRVAALWTILLVVFTISGSMIFGRDVFGMRTFLQAFTFLMTILVSAQLDEPDYRQMFRSQGTVADIYLITLFCTFWLILLNLVIAIISSSFLTNEAHGYTETTGFVDLARTYIFFNNRKMYSIDRIGHARGQALDGMSPIQQLTSRNMQILLPLRKRIAVLYSLRTWRLRSYRLVLETVKKREEALALHNRTVSFGEVMMVVQPLEHHLESSQLRGEPIVANMFVRLQKQRGTILNTVTESADHYARIADSLVRINRQFGKLATELRRLRNLTALERGGGGGGFGGGGDHGGDESGFGRPRALSSHDDTAAGLAGRRRRRSGGMSLAEYERLEAEGGADFFRKSQSSAVFSVHAEGDVEQLESDSSEDSALESNDSVTNVSPLQTPPPVSVLPPRALSSQQQPLQPFDEPPTNTSFGSAPPRMKSALKLKDGRGDSAAVSPEVRSLSPAANADGDAVFVTPDAAGGERPRRKSVSFHFRNTAAGQLQQDASASFPLDAPPGMPLKSPDAPSIGSPLVSDHTRAFAPSLHDVTRGGDAAAAVTVAAPAAAARRTTPAMLALSSSDDEEHPPPSASSQQPRPKPTRLLAEAVQSAAKRPPSPADDGVAASRPKDTPSVGSTPPAGTPPSVPPHTKATTPPGSGGASSSSPSAGATPSQQRKPVLTGVEEEAMIEQLLLDIAQHGEPPDEFGSPHRQPADGSPGGQRRGTVVEIRREDEIVPVPHPAHVAPADVEDEESDKKMRDDLMKLIADL